MLLPSALSCDIRGPLTRSRFASRLFSTPPPDDNFPAGNGLFGTCRALQSLLNGSPAPSARRAKSERQRQRLQSPLQLRTPPSSGGSATTRSSRAARTSSAQSKTAPPTTPPRPPPRGVNKRRRDSYEHDNNNNNGDYDDDCDMSTDGHSRDRFSTPKRRKHLPYDLPLGLAPCDFYSLHSPPITQSPPTPVYRPQESENEQEVMEDVQPSQVPAIDPDLVLPSIEEEVEQGTQQSTGSDRPAPPPPPQALLKDPSDWTAEDDQRLVEVVLDKFKLSRRDWEECARQMGKDNASVGRRWQALVGEGNVGLRRGRRVTRSRIDDSWR